MSNEIYKPTDCLDFGKNYGVPIFWIYRLHVGYLEWLIRETKVCFSDLNDFFDFGFIRKLDLDAFTQEQKVQIHKILIDVSGPIGHNSASMSVPGLEELIHLSLISTDDFKEKKYVFSHDLLKMNEKKLSKSYEVELMIDFPDNNYDETFPFWKTQDRKEC